MDIGLYIETRIGMVSTEIRGQDIWEYEVGRVWSEALYWPIRNTITSEIPNKLERIHLWI